MFASNMLVGCVTRLSNLRCSFPAEIARSGFQEMLYRPVKIPLLATLREKGLSRIFVGLTVLAMAGWVYLLSSMFLKFVLWCFS